MKGVFDVKPGSGYDDDITRRYHFPSQYLTHAESFVGDWILYREPQRNRGRKAYIAAARVRAIEPDPNQVGHYYAYVEQFMLFADPVPISEDGRYREEIMRTVGSPANVGRSVHGKSVRPISDRDFGDIVMVGLRQTMAPEFFTELDLPFPEAVALPETGIAERVDRQIEQILLNRKVRDRNFSIDVCAAYDHRCAVTRLRIINGGGRSEVDAAHIRPVADDGPDVTQNGIALSKTVHWLFDRHLISVTDDYRLLVAHNRVPRELQSLFPHHDEQIHLPSDPRLRPARTFLAHHRDRFAGAMH